MFKSMKTSMNTKKFGAGSDGSPKKTGTLTKLGLGMTSPKIDVSGN